MAPSISNLLTGKRKVSSSVDSSPVAPRSDGAAASRGHVSPTLVSNINGNTLTPVTSASNGVSVKPRYSPGLGSGERALSNGRLRGTSVARHQPTISEAGPLLGTSPPLDYIDGLLGTTPDGTPVYSDNTTSANHSRSTNFTHDERQRTASSSNQHHRRATVASKQESLASPGSSAESRMGRSASMSQRPPSMIVGEGSLSLEHLIRTPSIPVNTAPRVSPAANLAPPQASPEVRLYNVDSSASSSANDLGEPEVHAGELHHRHHVHYSPVFATSDIDITSSSSSDAAPANATPVIQLKRTPSNTDQEPPAVPAHQPTSPPRPTAASLAPATLSPTINTNASSEDLVRIRSGSASSMRPHAVQSHNLEAASSRKVSKKFDPSKGIAGALALSGVALAAPGPGIAHPIRMSGLPQPAALPPTSAPLSAKVSPGTDAAPSLQSATTDRSSHDDGRTTRSNTTTSHDGLVKEQTRSSEDVTGYESPTPISAYTPNDSPNRETDHYGTMSIDALGDFDDLMSQVGPGYAVASPRRNADFHHLFKSIPEDHWLIEDYGCALQREILIQGRLYISEHHLCFNANIFGWVTTVVLGFDEIIAIEKRNTALVIPNAIMVATMHSRHTFASFLSRDVAYELITSLWRYRHPVLPSASALAGVISDDEEDVHEGGGSAKKGKRRIGRFKRGRTGTGGESQSAITDGESTAHNTAADIHISGPRGNITSGNNAPHPPTSCNCLKGGSGHYPTLIMDATFRGTPEKLYNLIFTSGFMKDFLISMDLTELQIDDWAPQKTASHLLTRSYNYIKPINAPIGPKSAKCILVDENLHVDFDDFVVTLTTTRTPDVPSGGSFAVKTKTCLMWSRNNSTRVLVTSTVEWTGRSFIRSIVDKQSIDGQKALYVKLEESIRIYINQHRSEFYEAGEVDGNSLASAGDVTSSYPENGIDGSGTTHENGLENTSKVTGTVETDTHNIKDPFALITKPVPQLKPLCDFMTTIYDTVVDLIGQMSPTALICSAIIFVLVISNLFTLTSLRQKSSRYVPQRRPPPDYSSQLVNSLPVASSDVSGHQQDVAMAVRSALQDYFNIQRSTTLDAPSRESTAAGFDPVTELQDLRSQLTELEDRVQKLRTALAEVD